MPGALKRQFEFWLDLQDEVPNAYRSSRKNASFWELFLEGNCNQALGCSGVRSTNPKLKRWWVEFKNDEPPSLRKAKCVLLWFLCGRGSHCGFWICGLWNLGSGAHWTSPSRPHKVSAAYALSPSIQYKAQSQGWPCASFSPFFISLFLDFTTIRALPWPTERLWALASDTSGFKLQLFHLLVGRENCSEEKYTKVGRELRTWGKWLCLGQGAQTRAGPSPQGLYPAPHSLVTCWAPVPCLSQNAQNSWSPPSPSKPGRLRWHHQLLWALDPPLSPDSDQPYNWSSILQPVLAQPYSNASKYYCSTSLQGLSLTQTRPLIWATYELD